MGEPIQPALTAEEWAKARALAAAANEDHPRLPAADLAWWESNKLVFRGNEAGCECCNCFGIPRLVVAALALHDRITWEMVDALRESSERTADYDQGNDALQEVADRVDAVADLLESLLPPRAP